MTSFLMNLVSDADMCDCDKTNLTEEQIYGVADGTPCEAITVDLLQTYKRPIECYLRYKIWNSIESTKEELESAVSYLDTFIANKIVNPANCEGLESLYLIRSLVDKMLKKGVCL